MFKGFALAVAVILFGFCFYSLYAIKKPAFKGYGDRYEVYLSVGSFGNNIAFATDETFRNYKNIKGESCITAVPYEKVLKDFSATHLFSEDTDSGVSYYAYSPKIKYAATVRGKKVNIHYFAGKSENKVGSPLIYGGF